MLTKHTVKYRVRAHDVAVNKKMHLPALMRMLQDASLQHAILIGASIWDDRMENTSWVLIKKELKIMSYPALNTLLRVETYPSSFDKYFACRDWMVFDEQDQIIASATSQWAVINIESRKMARLPEHLFEIVLPSENLGTANFKLVFDQEPSTSNHYLINRFDLDWNGHLNNSRLIEYMTACIPASDYNAKFQNFKIQFKSEVLLGEKLLVEYYAVENKAVLRASNAANSKLVALAELSPINAK